VLLRVWREIFGFVIIATLVRFGRKKESRKQIKGARINQQ
jgi:hypothetical protein